MPQEYTPSGSPIAYTVPAYADVVDGPTAFKSFADDVHSGLAAKYDTAPVVNAQTGTSYTFATTDLGKTVTLSNASPVTLTLSTALSGLATGAILRIVNLGAGLVTVTPSGTTIAGTPLTLATNKGASLIKTGTNAYVMLPFSGEVRSAYSSSTGSPTITTVSGKTCVKFNASGTVTTTDDGFVKALVIGGGGGGASGGGGGGGAGGCFGNTGVAVDIWLPAGTHTITVGGGGAAATNGSPTNVSGYTALGGGAGRSAVDGNPGACGGGGGAGSGAGAAIYGKQGYAGGITNGGGGGTGAVGSAGLSGAGGTGVSDSIDGSATTRGGGGGGQTAGAGGAGGGGAGHVTATNPGTANTGGGGGSSGNTGGAGGSGTVILLFG